MDRFRLDDKIALVSGASSGIGAALALGLAQCGATIIAAARRVERLQRVVSGITAAGGRAHAVALDVTDPASVRGALDRAES
ncbi:MAG TPA: SDR family NAD(P)-dependent oxidoreductase, partial [Steroidobacteraceae bacterium]|nr:SDR family NAD(P)-dependent oxidoreductase [Steroidobacteraceae bacterium]